MGCRLHRAQCRTQLYAKLFEKGAQFSSLVWHELLTNYGESSADIERLAYFESFLNETCDEIIDNVWVEMTPEEYVSRDTLTHVFLTEFPNDLILKAQICQANYSRIFQLEEIIHRFPEVIIDRI